MQVPPSLQNIYKELKSEVGLEIPKHGHLAEWVGQGVLLLNTSLTVEVLTVPHLAAILASPTVNSHDCETLYQLCSQAPLLSQSTSFATLSQGVATSDLARTFDVYNSCLT